MEFWNYGFHQSNNQSNIPLLQHIKMARVRFENIQKSFGNTAAVRDLSFEIRDGEFFSILGPSGCGKTTTLRMLAGFETPETGKIFFDQEDVTSLPPEARHTGMVFQNYALFPHLTVFENVAFGLRARKKAPSEINARVAAALALVEMQPLQTRLVTQLSGGQQQRVALARAIAVQPRILLLDEPLSNLDAQLRRTTRTELKRLQRQLGITTIYVTHDQDEALALSDRMLIMHQGAAQQIGTPEEIYHAPANLFVMSFIGASNALSGKVQKLEAGKMTIAGDGWQFILPAPKPFPAGAHVRVAFRPEHCRIQTSQNSGATTLSGKISVIEFGGSHWLVQCEIGRQSCFARVPAEEFSHGQWRDSQEIRFEIAPENLRLFAE